jgi:FAD/FMN-containing dehydrogenase
MTELLISTREGTRAGIPSDSLENYADRLRGELISAGHQAYDQARRVWNGNIDRRPALIARCLGVADVMASVAFAREHDLLIAVRSGAHHAAGYGTCDGGLVIDLSRMKGMKVHPARSTADTQAGLLWGEFDHETRAFGQATIGGVMGSYGLSCDKLLSVDIVTADGKLLKASAGENPDRF